MTLASHWSVLDKLHTPGQYKRTASHVAARPGMCWTGMCDSTTSHMAVHPGMWHVLDKTVRQHGNGNPLQLLVLACCSHPQDLRLVRKANGDPVVLLRRPLQLTQRRVGRVRQDGIRPFTHHKTSSNDRPPNIYKGNLFNSCFSLHSTALPLFPHFPPSLPLLPPPSLSLSRASFHPPQPTPPPCTDQLESGGTTPNSCHRRQTKSTLIRQGRVATSTS